MNFKQDIYIVLFYFCALIGVIVLGLLIGCGIVYLWDLLKN